MKVSNNVCMNKVLLIDDDNRNIFALKAVLRSRAVDTVTTSNALDGMRLLDSDPMIRLVLLDMMMPELDGYTAIAQIRNSERSDVPIVAVTAQAMMGDRDKCLAAGADEYLAKPIDVDRLMDLVHQLLR
jgi:two-component system cell cycle response regulator DivK